MEVIHESLFEKHPYLRESYEAYKKRKAENKLTKWERCVLGEVFPEKVYVPLEPKENVRCELCNDYGYREYWENGFTYAEECECFNRIQSERAMKKAGVNREMTFDNWADDWEWQTDMGAKAHEYGQDGYLTGQWLFVGGQVGCGKTHVCTAVVNMLTEKAIGCLYMTWRDEATQLKAIVNDRQEYHERLMRLCKTPVLYIDDLFKTQSGMKPTQADVNLAFQIINYRYQDKKYCTIISCEYLMDEILNIDEAVGSRIYERSKAFRIEIQRDRAKNYRLKMG